MKHSTPSSSYHNVLAIGVFDLFHIGHLRYLQFAKSMGQKLIVGVASDTICHEFKGKFPVISEEHRAEIIKGFCFVDSVFFLPTSTEITNEAAKWISARDAHLVVIGAGWEGSDRWKRLIRELDKISIEVVFAPETSTISTSCIITKIQNQT